MAGTQLITIPFNEALRTLEDENSPKKLYFLMGNDHFLQKYFMNLMVRVMGIHLNI